MPCPLIATALSPLADTSADFKVTLRLVALLGFPSFMVESLRLDPLEPVRLLPLEEPLFLLDRDFGEVFRGRPPLEAELLLPPWLLEC